MACRNSLPFAWRSAREGSGDGRRVRNSPAAPDRPPSQAPRARRQRSHHGTHGQAPAAARVHRPLRPALFSAGQHHLLLRGRKPVGRQADLCHPDGRSGDGGRREVRGGGLERARAGGIGGRPHGHRPRRRDGLSHEPGRRSDHGADPRGTAARLRNRDHRRGRTGPPIPREAVVGRGLQRHDQHRHLSLRTLGVPVHSLRSPLRLRQGALTGASRRRAAALGACREGLLARRRRPRGVPDGAPGSPPGQGRGGYPGKAGVLGRPDGMAG